MFSASTELYDLIYCRMKDYAAEAATLAEWIARACPTARTVLDVACGTGEHAKHLAAVHGYQVDGIDLEPAFVELARRKHPGGRFTCADMCDFELGRKYDAVLCLFSSIGYARTLEGVTAALDRFRSHLTPGGVVIVEPWFTPDQFLPGHVHLVTAEGDGVSVCRMSSSSVEGRLSKVHFEYLVGRAEGVTHLTEDHVVGLFTRDEMLECFRRAGLTCEYDPEGLMKRGMYVARVAV